jgi:opacity protein-like surface antigen
MRRIPWIGLAVVFLAGWASAQVPTAGNVFFGYTYYSTRLSPIERANTNGWEVSVEGKVIPWVGIVADFSNHYGSENFPAFCADVPCVVKADVDEHNFLFGPRVSVSVGKVRPFAEGEIGAGHVNVKGGGSDTSFATALGGGLDYKLLPHLACRVQGDYVQTRFFNATQNNVRISTGIAVRF